LHAAGQLRPVVVPEPELGALRDLVRARDDLRGDLMAARHRVSKLLLRRGLVWAGPGETWSERHLRWLSGVSLDEPLADAVLGEYLGCHDVLRARRDRLDALIAEQAANPPWAQTVARLRCLRGVATLTAVGLVAEIGQTPDRPSRPSRTPSSWPATSGSCPPSGPAASAAGRERSPRPAPVTPAGC